MNSKKKKYKVVWVCDFCGKEFNTKKESDKHELKCSKNPINKNKKIETLVVIFIIFFFLYIFTYFIVDSYAQTNGFKEKSLTNPLEWFVLEEKIEKSTVIPTIITPTSTPTKTPSKTNQQTENNTNSTTSSKPPLPVLSGANIFALINQYRSNQSLPFLSVSDELCNLAEKRASLMMANNMEAFKNSSAGNHYQFDSVEYSGEGVGENIGANFAKDADVVNAWKKSPGHNALMLLTEKDGAIITKACVATRVSEVGSIVILLVGDK